MDFQSRSSAEREDVWMLGDGVFTENGRNRTAPQHAGHFKLDLGMMSGN